MKFGTNVLFSKMNNVTSLMSPLHSAISNSLGNLFSKIMIV